MWRAGDSAEQKTAENSWRHSISAEQVKYCLNFKQETFVVK